MNLIVALIPLLPLAGFLINGLVNKKMPKSLVGLIGSSTVLISFICSVYLFSQLLGDTQSISTKLFAWIHAGGINLDLTFLVDRLSSVMLLVITGVGFLIHVYSIGYMKNDEDYPRYMAYLNLFVFFMLLLVMGNNYIVMFAGWEGVGLCSYLLIGFWFKNTAYNNAGRKAFVMNRIGDFGFLLGIFLMYQTFATLDYKEVFEAAQSYPKGTATLTAITLLLFVGAVGKSAQIPLYTWLPDAMAGPTPVSALIHAATMVTAGIYMVVRSNILYALSPISSEIIAVIGLATAFMAATIAIKQNDIKKVLAYSTVSQLGYMFVALGVGAYTTGLFHVVTHAFFKALLFLCAGSVIHAMGGEQDIRKMGGLKKYIPITHITFLTGVLAIIGMPLFSGFFSKDEILAATWIASPIIFTLLALTSVLTAVYMLRLYWLTFHANFRGTQHQKEHLHESPLSMTIPLIALAVLSVLGGFIGMPDWINEKLGTRHIFNDYVAPVINSPKEFIASHTFDFSLLAGTIIGLALIYYYTRKIYVTDNTVPEDDAHTKGFAKILAKKYYVDEAYDAVIRKPLDAISEVFYKVFDLKMIDGLVNQLPKLTTNFAAALRTLQSGKLGFYLTAMVIGIICIFVFKLLM
ncbi:MAG: NADH-quinone oxidoreductase subunit L [Bacteroidia bacterium]|nr:NADH-quinone oxidoreductase subunit L [Bacteroidia bacterium]MCO5253728.1 NADH-quinone oxidoreductase subunit L [Bacteroidota bacterium]MCZ2128908.1 NADH-quinone oxidoreductase subunit L [Bacteroidia bacterium]